jgi:GNAT superfamily N-acetyltransferase
MGIELRYIHVGELEEFIISDEYKVLSDLPISKLRGRSQARNPRADRDDIALILAYDNETLAGYLGLLPDRIYADGRSLKICWYSCLWVMPEYRRRGLAMRLIDDAFEKYNGLVCISNYHSPSKAAIVKTGKYKEVEVLHGLRAYLRFRLQKMLPGKYPKIRRLSPLLWALDFMGNLAADVYFSLVAPKASEKYRFENVQVLTDELSDYIDSKLSGNIFKRSREEFKWIVTNPWLTNDAEVKSESLKYHFSWYSPDYKKWAIQMLDPNGNITGFVVLIQHQGSLKTHYLLAEDECLDELLHYIYRLMRREGIATLITHHTGLTGHIKRKRNLFIALRKSQFGFMVSSPVEAFLAGNFGNFDEGDGDSVFT